MKWYTNYGRDRNVPFGAGKDSFLTLNNIASSASDIWESCKGHDPVMMRNTCSMRSALYRRSAPNKELWHSDISFNYSLCMVAVALAVGMLAAVTLLNGCRRRMFCHRRRHR